MIEALLSVAASAGSVVAPPACVLPEGWSRVVAPHVRYIIFGELHGTVQSAATFADVACAESRRGQRLLIAVELSSTQNGALQQAWKVQHAGFATALRQFMPEWSTRKDGVTSRAMFAMLVRLHALKAAGRPIDIVAFNGVRDDAQRAKFEALPMPGQHEAAQAENIRQADHAGRHDRVLILVGMYHARKRPLTIRGITYEPMAMKLANPRRVAALNMMYGGGSSWYCALKTAPAAGAAITDDLIDCSAHPSSGNVSMTGVSRLVPSGDLPPSANPDLAYDGGYFVGPVMASPPLGAAVP